MTGDKQARTAALESVPYDRWNALDASLMDGFRWHWCDLDGQHVGEPFPAQPPLTTHMWGWADGAWVRLRVDGDMVVGAILRDSPATSGQVVAIIETDDAPQRFPSGGVPVQHAEFTVRTLRCVDPVSLTFIELELQG